jgi:hypothetical protein
MIRLRHIDAIARAERRDVIFVRFSAEILSSRRSRGGRCEDASNSPPLRTKITEWLDSNGFTWEPCADVANIDQVKAYEGQIYIDLPCDDSLPAFGTLTAYLETPDGKSRFKGVQLSCCPLELSMKNAHHDAPGFWDQWAENF